MKGSSSERGILLAVIAMTVGTLAVAGLAGAMALRPTATPTATATATATPTPTPPPTSDGFADERPPPGPPPPTPTIATPEAPPVVRRAPRERIEVPRAVSAWGT